jgi:hypothetical protein
VKRLILAASFVLAVLIFPSGAMADSPICHNGILSDDAGQGCTNDGAYGGAPASSASSGGWSDGAICHDGILSDDAGQNCADGMYERVYGSGGSSSSSSASTASSSGSGICHDGILSNDVGQGCADSGSVSSSSSGGVSAVSSAPAVSSSSSYSDVPGVPSSFAACVALKESTNGAGSSNIYGILVDPRGNGSLAEQKQAFSELYAANGTSPWHPYDGC